MNHERLKKIVFDQHEVIQNTVITPRDYEFEAQANYVLVGLRRAGKSTILYDLVNRLIKGGMSWEQVIYINFEDERLSEFTLDDFQDIVEIQRELSEKKGVFLLDEIQNIAGWEKFARRLADRGERVYITGSNARMLSREIETTLGGRFFSKYIEPYSFREYLSACKIKTDEKTLLSTDGAARIRSKVDDYEEFGGFPEILRYQNKRDYLTGIFQKILLGDIALRNNIRNDYALKLLIRKVAESVRNEISFTKLHHALQSIGVSVSKDTVIDYMQFAKEAFLIFDIKNYFFKFSEREGNPKYYFGDNGLLDLFLLDKSSSLLENLVALELRRRYRGEVFYLKSAKIGVDVDFFVPEKEMAVQVAYSISGEAREREVGSLKRLHKYFSEAKEYYIITKEETEEIIDGDLTIHVLPVSRLLLGELTK